MEGRHRSEARLAAPGPWGKGRVDHLLGERRPSAPAGVGGALALCRSSLKLPSLLRPLMEKEGCVTLPTVWGPITTGSM